MSDDREGALGGLTILDLSEGIAGPFAARLFAEYGARVIKIERPGHGDVARAWGPYAGGEAGPERGAVFHAANAGKLSLTLDYETPTGAAVLRRLAEEADGIIEDHPTRRRAELELDAASLIAHVPRLVIAQICGFGASGPYSDRPLTSLTLAAAAGLLPEGGDFDATDHRTEHLLGLHVFVATLAGLWNAAQTEHGQVVDVGGLEALASSHAALGYTLTETALDGAGRREVEHPVAGRLVYAPPPFALEAAEADLGRAPLLGEHTDHVLHDVLGLEASEIEALRVAGVV